MDEVVGFWSRSFRRSWFLLVLLIMPLFYTRSNDRKDQRQTVHFLNEVAAIAQHAQFPFVQEREARTFVTTMRQMLPASSDDPVADMRAIAAVDRLTIGTSGAFMRRFLAPPTPDEQVLLDRTDMTREQLASTIAFLRTQRSDTHEIGHALALFPDRLAAALRGERFAQPALGPFFPSVVFLIAWIVLAVCFVAADAFGRRREYEDLRTLAENGWPSLQRSVALEPSLFSAQHVRSPGMWLTAFILLPGVLLALFFRGLGYLLRHRTESPAAHAA